MGANVLILTLSEWLGVIAILMLAGLSPRLNVPSVGFKYPRREGWTGISLFVFILLLRVLVSSGSIGISSTNLYESRPPDFHLGMAVLALIPFLLALFIRKQPPRSAGWYGKALSGGIRVGLVLALLTVILRGQAFSLLNGISPEEGRSLILWLGICLAEETVFRGFIQMRLVCWLGKWPGILLTTLLSLAWTWPYLESTGTGLAWAVTAGVVRFVLLGWIAHKSKHVLAPVLYRTLSEWLYLVH